MARLATVDTPFAVLTNKGEARTGTGTEEIWVGTTNRTQGGLTEDTTRGQRDR